MLFSEALRYLSRFYNKDKRGSGHKQSKPTVSPLDTEPTANESSHATSTTPLVAARELRQEDLEVADNLIRRSSERSSKDSQQPGERQPLCENVEPPQRAKKASTPSKSGSEDLYVSKSGGRSRASPLRKSLVSNSSEYQTPPATGDGNQDKSSGLLQIKDANAGSSSELKPEQSTRQSSSQTLFSDRSCATVQRDPSKRCESPIPTIDSRIMSENHNPFSDKRFRLRSDNDSPFADKHAMQRSSDMTGSEDLPRAKEKFSSENRDAGSNTKGRLKRSLLETSRSSGIPVSSRISSRSSDDVSRRIFSGTDTARREAIRSRALTSFNASVEALGVILPTKTLRKFPNSEEEDCVPGRSNSLFSRIRSVKSNIGLRHKNSAKRTLRRIKTMANLSAQHPIGILKGRSLEELARLGGASNFDLPEGYGPRALKLPICFCATLNYLLQHSTSVDHLHGDIVDNDVVRELYSYYADHVLSAEISKDTIDETTRAIEPIERVRSRHLSLRGNDFIHDVCSVFRHFLCGIPGGILGSKYLCEVIQHTIKHDFKNSPLAKDPGREEYIPESPHHEAAKTRLIALALVAMTRDMQLDLICAVFGVLSFTADETEKATNRRSSSGFYGYLPASGYLDAAFGLAHVDPTAIRPPIPESYIVKAFNFKPDELVVAITRSWKDICVHLERMGIY